MLISNARVFCADEISTGLDANVTYHILSGMQQMTRINRVSVVIALLQPTPEVYGLFDDIILMRDGEIVYHGPRTEVKPYFLNCLGIEIPVEVDEAGFLVDFLTDPVSVVRSVERMRIRRNSTSAQNTKPHPTVQHGDNDKEQSLSKVNFHTEDAAELHLYDHADDSLFFKLASPAAKSVGKLYPALTTKELLTRYHNSNIHAAQLAETDLSIANCRNDEALKLSPANWSSYTRQQFAQPFPHSYMRHTKLDIARQSKVTFRNKQLTIPRLVQSVLMGFIFGTLFFQLNIDDYQSKMGLLLYSVMFGTFANLSELPAAAEARNVITKQLDAGFLPTPPYIISNIFWSIPRIAVETAIFGTLMYWIPNFVPDAGRFFFWLLVLFAGSLSLSTFFRTISFVASNPDVARQMDFPFILIFVIFGGFLIPYQRIPNWLIWLYWLNPLSWGVRSISQNEFLSSRYDAINSSGQRKGDAYLDAFGMQTEGIYKWMGIVYLAGFFVLFAFISAFSLQRVRQTGTLGTKRLTPVGEKQLQEAQGTRGQQADPSAGAPDSNYRAEEELKRQTTNQRFAEQIAIQVAQGSSKAFSMHSLPFVPVTLAWKNIKYTVYVGKENKPKLLLKGISGFSKPGTLTALMGSSGAGKTTLMDVIAGRKTVGTIEGDILVNGKPKIEKSFNQLTGYVEQQDLHMGLTTVREALVFSAKLRLPISVSEKQRLAWVDEVMNLVGLTRIQHRLIGDAAVAGLSPGQLKLLTIAVELVANPSVLFLDG
jgi:ABC-type multidrug transport system ATPase subunit/ABC-type multidrug transport system permease subunit